MRHQSILKVRFILVLGAAALTFTSAARADDWSIGIFLPGVVVVSPEPEYVPYPWEYYGPAHYPPAYVEPPQGRYGGYDDPSHGGNHHEDDGAGDDDE